MDRAIVSCASCCLFMSASTFLSTRPTSSCAWRYLPTQRSMQLISPTWSSASLTEAIHFRWQTLDILLNKSVIISISILAAVRRASAAGEVLLPPRNQDMVLSYVARPTGWLRVDGVSLCLRGWSRVDGVSLRLRASRCDGASVAGRCYALCQALRCRTNE